MKLKILYFLILLSACGTKKFFYGGELYKGYKDRAFLYKNDSLDFKMSYLGGSHFFLNPSQKDFSKLCSKLPKSLIPKFDGSVLLFKKNYDDELFGYSQIMTTDLEEQKNKSISSIKKIKKLDSLVIAEDTLKTRKIIKLNYGFRDELSKYSIIEYLIPLAKAKTLKLVTLTLAQKDIKFKTLLDYSAFNTLASFQYGIKQEDEQLMSNPYFYISNSFRDYNYNYLTALVAIKKFEQKSSKTDNSSVNANFYSFVGDYKNMMKNRDSEVPKFNWTASDSLALESYEIKSAKEEILKNTKDKQVVMINENHLNPYSRVFVEGLLKDLNQQGFSYLGVETLVSSSTSDSALNDRKYPIQKNGYYTAEPCFGNLIRTSLEENFNVFSYEYNTQSDTTGKIQKRNHREKSQALNILKILEKNPTAKIIIYAGHDHIQKKSNNPQVRMMANYFKLLSGIEPFCIEQATMIEGIDKTKEHQAYKQVMKKYNPTTSIVLKKNNDYWTVPEKKGFHEMCVFHPRSEYESNHPSWLLNSTGNNEHEIKLDKTKNYKNCLLQVYVKDEYDNEIFEAIPVINRIIDGNTNIQVKLKKGQYTILIFDKFKNALYKENIKFN